MFCYREIHLIVSRLEFSLLVRVDVAFRLSKKCGAGIVKTPTLFNQDVINIHQNDFENEHVFAVLKVFPDDQYTWHTHTHTTASLQCNSIQINNNINFYQRSEEHTSEL